MTTAICLPPAEEEMIAAAQYYQQQSAGLGSEFLATKISVHVDPVCIQPGVQ